MSAIKLPLKSALELLGCIYIFSIFNLYAEVAPAPIDELEPRVVMHQTIQQPLDVNLLRKIFTGQYGTWPNGDPVIVVMLPIQHPNHAYFVQARLRMFVYQIERIWQQRIYSGRSNPPTILENEQAILEYVSRTPGAIGYVTGASTTDWPVGVALKPRVFPFPVAI